MMQKLDVIALKKWFLQNRRVLPWRDNPSPYAVWVSEVMLQQTQVAVVIPYFERWMQKFPTISHLAAAPLDEIIKVWEGLGYYSRARNMHEAAQYLMKHFHGELPSTNEELSQLKGLGPYTIGAIRSFAFHQKAPAIDGNVVRVVARLLKIEDPVDQRITQNLIRGWVEANLPHEEPWIISEGLIELGATVCSKVPKCPECPLRKDCLAYRNGVAQELPKKSKKTTIEKLYRAVPIIKCKDHFLIQRGAKGKVMSDLHEFPYFETSSEGLTNDDLLEQVNTRLGLEVNLMEVLPEVNHGFTRYNVFLRPILLSTEKLIKIPDYSWHHAESIQNLAFSSGHKRILKLIQL